MSLPCGHPELTDGPCPLCRHEALVARLAVSRGENPAPAAVRGKAQRPIPTAVPECVHRGGVVGTDDCQVCPGNLPRRVEVLACAVKGTCTVDPAGRVRGVQRCQTCLFEPKVPAPTPLESGGHGGA